MDQRAFLNALLAASTSGQTISAIENFENAEMQAVGWAPIGGKENNRGPIEISADPARSLVERLTNGIDAVIEAEYEHHRGMPDCRSPREAASAWFGVPAQGLSGMTPAQRQTIGKRITVRLAEGSGREARLVEVRDRGIGLAPGQMAGTILSLNESNKIRKHYVAGTYGQGGSSTFAISRYTLIASRCSGEDRVGFTVVKFLDLPAEDYKTGHYVFLTVGGEVPFAELPESEFPVGTLVRHIDYDLSNYPSPLGPNSVYGLLNQVLFDPVLPIWLDSEVHGYRRVIKGSRNALNGAVDEGDERPRGPVLDHNVPIFYVSLGDPGNVGFEYWVLERPNQGNKRPSQAFINPSRPIILTLNGQNHAELPASVVRKEAGLPYLSQRLIIHINCDPLTAAAKRALFASSREDARRGFVLQLIHDELIRILRSDDELERLNNEAREHGMHERDENAIQRMRSEVARLLRLQGIDIGETSGSSAGGEQVRTEPVSRSRRPRTQPVPIDPHEPPTYIRIVWNDERIGFYPTQRRYIRVETDANSSYLDLENSAHSRINIVVGGPIVYRGSTPLRGGRMRAILDVSEGIQVGATGWLRVELSRPGLPVLSDQRDILVHEAPPSSPGRQRLSLPPFETRPVSPQEDRWTELGWPDDIQKVASSAEKEDGILVIYYSTAYPKFAGQVMRYEQRNPGLAVSFTRRYEIWLAAHSLLYYRDQEGGEIQHLVEEEAGAAAEEDRERQERCRMATLAALFATNEVDHAEASGESQDS